MNYEAGRGFPDMTGCFRTYLGDGEFVYFVLMSYNLPSMGAFHVFVVKCLNDLQIKLNRIELSFNE